MKNWFFRSKPETKSSVPANSHANPADKLESSTKNFHKIEIIKYDEVVYALKLLERHRQIIVSLVNTDPSDRRRIVDFLSGFAYARHGQLRLSAKHIYIFTLTSE